MNPLHAQIAETYVRALLRRAPNLHFLSDDLRQEAAIGVLMASRVFDRAHGVPFAAYARIWIVKRVGKLLKASKVHSAETTTVREYGEDVPVLETLAAEYVDPDIALIAAEDRERQQRVLLRKMRHRRDPETAARVERAMELRGQGMTYKAIGAALGCSKQAVHQWLSQVGAACRLSCA